MWSRIVLKDRAKVAFKRNYWRCVLVSFILMLFTGGATSASNIANNRSSDHHMYYEDYWDNDFDIDLDMDDHMGSAQNSHSIASWMIGSIIAFMISGIMLVILALKIFVFQPLEIGGCRFYMENTGSIPSIERLLFAYKSGYYGKMVLTLFLRALFIGLWSLLLVVPGIIKAYEYRMIPYLLADCPEMSRADAFRSSKEMMYGQKMEAFLLDLSFIGWLLLSGVTCGIVGIFYVSPYIHATNAELFLTLRSGYFQGRRM